MAQPGQWETEDPRGPQASLHGPLRSPEKTQTPSPASESPPLVGRQAGTHKVTSAEGVNRARWSGLGGVGREASGPSHLEAAWPSLPLLCTLCARRWTRKTDGCVSSYTRPSLLEKSLGWADGGFDRQCWGMGSLPLRVPWPGGQLLPNSSLVWQGPGTPSRGPARDQALCKHWQSCPAMVAEGGNYQGHMVRTPRVTWHSRPRSYEIAKVTLLGGPRHRGAQQSHSLTPHPRPPPTSGRKGSKKDFFIKSPPWPGSGHLPGFCSWAQGMPAHGAPAPETRAPPGPPT